MTLRRLLTGSGPPVLGTALVAVMVLTSCAVPLTEVAVYAVYVLLGIGLPGVFTWRLLLRQLHDDDSRRPTWLEDLSLGTILGFGVQLPFFLVGVGVGLPQLALVFPATALALSATRFGRTVWSLPTARLPSGASWALAAVAVYGLMWLRHNVFPDQATPLSPNQVGIDVSFHQALVSDIANRFPPQIPFLLDTRLDYHWFVHAQIATSGDLTGIDSATTLRMLLPVMTMLLIVAGLGALAMRLGERTAALVIAPALLVVGVFHLLGPDYPDSDFTEPFLTWRYVTSPSQTYGVMMSLPALMLILEALRPGRRVSGGASVALALALLALSGSKATFLPILLCGAVAAWLLGLLVQRRVDRAATGVVVLVALATLFAQFVLFGGSAGGFRLDPFQTVEAALDAQGLNQTPTTRVTMTGTLVTAWLLYGAGVVGLIAGRRLLDLRAAFLVVSAAAGIVAALLFTRVGNSQLWFQHSVAEMVVLLSAWGMSVLLPRPLTAGYVLRLSGLAAAAAVGAFVCSTVVGAQDPGRTATSTGLALTTLAPLAIVSVYFMVRLLIRRAGTDRRRPGPVLLVTVLLGLGVGNAVQFGQDLLTGEPASEGEATRLFTDDGLAAAEYVRDHSSIDDIVATNMHCREPHERPCDNRHFWLSANTERRVVIEGWGYTLPTNQAATGELAARGLPVPLPQRLALNDAAFSEPSEETVGRLVDTYSVDWLVVSEEYAADVPGLRALDDLLELRHRSGSYAVFEVR